MTQRIAGYDVARACAIVGMILVNFRVVMVAEESEAHWLLNLVDLVEGRAAATFVVLAGVGLSLLSAQARMERNPALLRRNRRNLFARAAFLFVAGLAYLPIWPGDILHFYAVYLVIGACLLRAPSRSLIQLAAGLTCLSYVLLFALDYDHGWKWETLDYIDLWTLRGMVRNLFYNGYHPVCPWVAFLLVGMVLGRLDMRHAVMRRRILFGGIALAAAAEISSLGIIAVVSNGAEPAAVEDIRAVFGTKPMPPTLFYMAAGLGTAMTVIALSVGVAEQWANARWLQPMISTGQLALSLYVGHVVVGMGLLEAMGTLYDRSAPFTVAYALAFCGLSVLWAHWWRKRHDRGPLEWAMRRVTAV